MASGTHGPKRTRLDELEIVQERNREWWEATPMSYDWRVDGGHEPLSLEWFDEQDRRSAEAHRHFATDTIPFDRLIPYGTVAGKEVLEVGVGSGFHAELLARAGARVTGIDLTQSAIERTRTRFGLKQLAGSFEQWDAEQPREDFERRFAFVWSWGVIHHSSRTARVVRNVGRWLADDGGFAGMVYHRNSTGAVAAVVRDWLLRGKIFSHSLDEALWRGTDGFSARFYPAEQWRDLLLAFFRTASVSVTGMEADYLPLPRAVRTRLAPHYPERLRERVLARAGTFVTFQAEGPLR